MNCPTLSENCQSADCLHAAGNVYQSYLKSVARQMEMGHETASSLYVLGLAREQLALAKANYYAVQMRKESR